MTMEGSVQVKYSNLLLKKDCHQWRHRMLNKILTAVALVMLLAGCSAFTSSQSLIADENWFQLGYNKGKWGEKAISEQSLQADTLKVSEEISPDYEAYQRGYQKGLESYCTLEQLRQMGMERKMDWGVCEFRREDGGLYKMFWQQGFDRSMAFDGVTSY